MKRTYTYEEYLEDIVYCKINFKIELNNGIVKSFIMGDKMYIDRSVGTSDTNEDVHVLIDSKSLKSFFVNDSELSNYVETIKEQRKNKLKKIYESNL